MARNNISISDLIELAKDPELQEIAKQIPDLIEAYKPLIGLYTPILKGLLEKAVDLQIEMTKRRFDAYRKYGNEVALALTLKNLSSNNTSNVTDVVKTAKEVKNKG